MEGRTSHLDWRQVCDGHIHWAGVHNEDGARRRDLNAGKVRSGASQRRIILPCPDVCRAVYPDASLQIVRGL